MAVVVGTWLVPAAVIQAQSVPTGYQEFFVIGNEDHMWRMMRTVAIGEGAGSFDNAPGFVNGMDSVVTATASADNQILFYDHWEDGFEADIQNPGQATSLALGDGNAGNGQACSYTTDPRVAPCDGTNDDILFQGTEITLNSDQGLPGVVRNPQPAGACTPGLPAAPAVWQCSVPVNPRNSADVRFDGGDRVVTSGGPISLVHTQDPLSPYIGGSNEMISSEAVANAVSYSIPVGVDSYNGDGWGAQFPVGTFEPFKYVELDLVAYEDNVQVFINSPGAGTVSVTLNRGQHYSSQGFIDAVAATPLTINAGTKISTTGALGGVMFTGGDGTFATRHFAILPDRLHDTDYIITAPGDDPGANGNRTLNIYAFNPDPVNSLTVNFADSFGTGSTVIPPNSVVDYRSAMGRFVPSGSTVRLTSDRNFWGVSAYDHQTSNHDWGHSWLATRFLTSTYTISHSPHNLDPTNPALPNGNPVFIAATQDRTRVQVDFDNDGVFDPIDLNGDNVADAAPLPNNTYVIDALQALRVYDPTDRDNTGSRIVASHPVAVTWGQDTDLPAGSDPVPDMGYTVYPVSQSFLDPVLVLDKDVDLTTVPTAGGIATYTVTITSYDFGPLTVLQAWDLLPVGIPAASYVAGTTLITYPDLSQNTDDPALSVDPGTGRGRLDWTLAPNTLGANQALTIRYSVSIPAAPGGTPRLLTNEGRAEGRLGGSFFSPSDTADLVQTDIALTKSVDTTDPGEGDVLTFTLTVSNSGVSTETNVFITDPLPPNTTFVGGSITTAGPFVGVFDPAQNAVLWTAANFAPGGPHALTFQARVNPGAPAGTLIENRGGYESNQTPYFLSNPVQPVVVGAQLGALKSGPAGPLHPNEVAVFEILVQNTGAASATALQVFDTIPPNTTYVPGSMSWRLNAGAFDPLTDAADADPGTFAAGQVQLSLASLGPREDATFRFEVQVDPGTAGQFVNNQGLVSATDVIPFDTNLLQIPIVGDADVTGHVFLDLDGNGVQDPGEPDLADVTVTVTDSAGVSQTVTTDANGDYLATVVAGSTTLDVDDSDPDIPPGSTLTAGSDPQTPVAVSGGSVAASPVGYQPRPLSIDKVSSAAGSDVAPGETITYAISVTNYTDAAQAGIDVQDAVPAGATYVAGSGQVTVGQPAFRVTEYYVAAGSFTGATYTLNLNQALAGDYFVIVQGAGSDGTDAAVTRGPNQNYARLSADPTGRGDLTATGVNTQIQLTRGSTTDSWVGVVSVVECVADCDVDGFRLRSVEVVDHLLASTGGTDTSATAWGNLSQVQLVGGFNGAGCSTAQASSGAHKVCHARIWPSGTNTINWTRNAGGTALTTASSTVMAVEWGSGWTVQRARVQGTNGDDGLDVAGEYNTGALGTPVARNNTWVWGTGHTDDNGIGDAGEGAAITLGDGEVQNGTESTVAVGTEYGVSPFDTTVDFEVYALTHGSLAVDYRFKADGDQANTLVPVTVDSAPSGGRMALTTNGQNGTGTAYPRPLLWARYLNDTTVRIERSRSGQPFPAWVQGIDYSAIGAPTTTPSNAPPNLVVPADGYTLAPLQALTVTFQVVVDDPLAAGITEIVNTATAESDQEGPYSDTTRDPVARPAVAVEYNNAEFATAGSTVFYTHNVVNRGPSVDSFLLTVESELGWSVELIDPDSGAVVATDSNGDGTWDGGGTVSTGTLAPDARAEYRLRVTVPAGTPPGTQETTLLIATSGRQPTVWGAGENETTVLGAADFGPIALLPDNSGVVTAGSSTWYAHRVVNRTGATDTFDLQAIGEQEWTATLYYDANDDGVYSPGLDIAVTNTRQLADGESQLVFVVVDAPAGTPADTVEVTHLTAWSRNDPTLFDGATDTTTVVAATTHDLSGGGSRLVDPAAVGGDIAIFPGTLVNLGASADTFDFGISESSLNGVDGLTHPTQLWIDTDADGIPDLEIAEDSNGDGTWNTVLGGYDGNGNGLPEVIVDSGVAFAYELRRAVDPNLTLPREYVTLSATSTSTGETDNVTATIVLAAVTRATIGGIRGYSGGVIEFVTESQQNTAAFNLYEVADRRGRGRRHQLNDSPVLSPVPHSMWPILYRVKTRPPSLPYLLIEEIETTGKRRLMGPFSMADPRLRRGLARTRALLDQIGVPSRGMARRLEGKRVGKHMRQGDRARRHDRKTPRRPRPGRALEGVKITVTQPGWVQVSEVELRSAGLSPGGLRLTSQGRPVPYTRSVGTTPGVTFLAEGLSTDFTDANVYVLTSRSRPFPMRVPLTRSGDVPRPGSVRIEKNTDYLAWAPEDADPWIWDYLFPDTNPWPASGWDPEAGTFDIPRLAPGTSGDVPVRIRLFGNSDHAHTVEASLNGYPLGSVTFAGKVTGLLTSTVPGALLRETGNELALIYTADGGTEEWAWACLDYLEIDAPTTTPPPTEVVDHGLEPYSPQLPRFGQVDYLIITHSQFEEPAQRVAELKRSDGLGAAVVDVQAAYDRFSGGIVEPNAIDLLIRHAWRASRGRLQYVLLVGDDTIDTRDIWALGSVSYVPSPLTRDRQFGRVPSENPYADVNGDGRPDLAIGRLPAQTADEAWVMVDKIARQDELVARYLGRHLFAVDNDSESDAPFRAEAEAVIEQLPAGSAVELADVGDGVGAARETVEAAWQAGAMMTHFFGHGGPEIWADEQLLSVDSVNSQLASAPPTVLLAWACESQWYLYLWGPTVNESLLLLPDAGALASFGPTGITPPALQQPLYQAFYNRLLNGEERTLGRIILGAKRDALVVEPRALEAVEGFCLLGDPALRIPDLRGE